MSIYGELWLCGLGVLVSLFLRSCVSLHPYSGKNTPPMFGDYEAQRHWMELTVNLPIKDWYINTTNNDLMYWGLDYPPLTAYHSWLCGQVAKFINPNYVELNKSRGFESEEHKVFMRFTVILVDLLIYIPAICAYFYIWYLLTKRDDFKKGRSGEKVMSYSVCIVLALLYPGIILIDHGHFQYNCVSLGLTIIAIIFINIHKHILASIFFCLALNYKQMELYHAIPFFIYLLSSCVPKPGQNLKNSIIELIKIGTTVLITFMIIWAPFLTNFETTKAVIDRLFPLGRGVFEDKVANFWCTLNIFFKLKKHLTNIELARNCLLMTLIAVLPSSIDLFLRPSVRKFILALINSSLAFFLFSFQVHEKSILLVSIPVILYFPYKPIACFWFLFMSSFSMTPLLIKDELNVAYFALTIFYIAAFQVAIDYTYRKTETKTDNSNYIKEILITLLEAQNGTGSSLQVVNITFDYLMKNKKLIQSVLLYIVFYACIAGCFFLFFLSLFMEPPENYPDIFALLVSVYSFVHFFGFFIYFNICQFSIKQDFVHSFKFKQE